MPRRFGHRVLLPRPAPEVVAAAVPHVLAAAARAADILPSEIPVGNCGMGVRQTVRVCAAAALVACRVRVHDAVRAVQVGLVTYAKPYNRDERLIAAALAVARRLIPDVLPPKANVRAEVEAALVRAAEEHGIGVAEVATRNTGVAVRARRAAVASLHGRIPMYQIAEVMGFSQATLWKLLHGRYHACLQPGRGEGGHATIATA